MKTYQYPPREQWSALLARPTLDIQDIRERVQPILDAVAKEGDAAVRRFTARFDGIAPDALAVTPAEFQAASVAVPEALKSAIALAADNIRRFHEAQVQPEPRVMTMPGVQCWRKSLPIESVGLYIPGGTAPLFSTILMLAIPAQVAGCPQVVLCTPPDRMGAVHPAILYTAQYLGIDRVYKVGGAQAIAAMAFGTETIPRVFKIFGPGNQYVTAAKQLVNLLGTAIDMPAGPSEVAVFADETAVPAFVAADLLSQAEHGTDSQVVLVTTSVEVQQAVALEVQNQLTDLPRRDIAAAALQNSVSIVVKDAATAIDLLNAYAAEHLILATDEAAAFAESITAAGSVFLGHYTPESVGDYASGTNHTLPTNGFARAYSGVAVDAFVKKVTFQQLTPAGLEAIGAAVETMALAEQLAAHQRAVAIRRKAISSQ